jgi:protein-disulfide isomerase
MPKKSPPGPKSGPNRTLLIALGVGAAVVVAIVIGVLALGGGGDDESVDVASVAYLEGIPQERDVLGSADAPVTMIQFEDLQCPVCKAYTEGAMEDIVTEFVRPGDVKLRFVGLAFIGPDSEKALRYTLAAGKQSQLWQYLELLYANQGPENAGWVTDSLLESIATGLGLDWEQLQADAESASVTQQINTMSAEAQAKQVSGTPTFFVQVGDGEPYQVQVNEFSVDAFRPIFEDALSQASQKK